MTLNLAGEEGEWRRGGRRELEGEASIKARLRTLGAEALVYLLAVCWQPAVNCREEGRVSSFINLRASEPCEPASHASQRASHASHASHASPSKNVKIFYLLHLHSHENKNKSNGTR